MRQQRRQRPQPRSQRGGARRRSELSALAALPSPPAGDAGASAVLAASDDVVARVDAVLTAAGGRPQRAATRSVGAASARGA